MKKFLSFAFAFAMLVAVASCGSKDTKVVDSVDSVEVVDSVATDSVTPDTVGADEICACDENAPLPVSE